MTHSWRLEIRRREPSQRSKDSERGPLTSSIVHGSPFTIVVKLRCVSSSEYRVLEHRAQRGHVAQRPARRLRERDEAPCEPEPEADPVREMDREFRLLALRLWLLLIDEAELCQANGIQGYP